MTLHKLNHKYWIDLGRGFRINKLEVTADPYTGHITAIWFRKGSRFNGVASMKYRKPKPYPPQPEYITVYQRLPTCDRNLDPDIAHGIAVMLDTYCVWLNKHLDADTYPIDHRYNPRQFLDSHQYKEPYLYGSCYIDAMYDSDYHNVIAITIYDGDDGGPTSLTGWFSGMTWHANDPHQLENMTQEFDTLIQFILNDGKFVNVPDEPVTSDTTTTTPQED